MRLRSLALFAVLAGCRGAPSGDAPAPAASASVRAAVLSAPSDGGSMVGATAALATRGETAARLRPRSPARARADETIDIPARTFASGSTPGDEGRDPALEPINVPVTLDAFAIDALPYPNDPALPPKTGLTRAEAQRACEDRGERLCTELEWELACKGPDLDPFATGEGWDAACEQDGASCPSGYGARAMGVLREWTAGSLGSQAAVRGAGTAPVGDAGPPSRGAHRCSHRARAGEARGAPDLGFRCCKGTPNAAQVPPVAKYPPFRPASLDATQLAKVFATIPELSTLKDVRLYSDDQIADMAAHASRGVEFTAQPLLWSPEGGEEVLVAAGRTKSMSFIVALYPLRDDTYRLASYFLMLGDVSPVALAYEAHRRETLLWSTCWGCPGEQGSVHARDDHRIVIVQH